MERSFALRPGGAARPPGDTARRFARLACRLAHAPVALLAFPGSARSPLTVVATGSPAGWTAGWEREVARVLAGRLAALAAPLALEELDPVDPLRGCVGAAPAPAACAAVTVRLPGRRAGVLAVLDVRARSWTEETLELLEDLGALAGGSFGASAGEGGDGAPTIGWQYPLSSPGVVGAAVSGREGGGTSAVPPGPVARGRAAPAGPGEEPRALLEAAPVPVVGLDPAGKVTLWNAAAENAFGWRAGEVVGLPFPLAGAGARDELASFLAEAQRGAGPATLEGRRRRRDGSPVEVSMSGSALRGPDGRPCGVVAVVLDVTERRAVERDREQLLMLERAARARAELAEDRAQVLAYASEVLDAGFVSAPEERGRVLAALAAVTVPTAADYCRIDELNPDGSVERVALAESGALREAPAERYPADADDGCHPAVRAARAGEPLFLPEAGAALEELFPPDPARETLPRGIRSLVVVPLTARGRTLGALTLATAGSRRRYDADDLRFAEDLALRVALALDNVRLYREAEASARLRDEVLAVVSHDLRNPLNVITFSSDVLLRAWPSDPARAGERRQVEGIALSAQRMRRLIQDLLDVARVQAGSLPVERVPEHVVPLILETLELHAALAEERAILTRVSLPQDAPPVLADRDRVLQVLANLMANAIRFTPQGGAVALSAQVEPLEVRFSVADTGPGIHPEHLTRVFDRFWRAQPSRHEGAGLGLAIARGIVEAHGGRIWAESRVGEGSTFHFTLPRADLSPAAG